MNRRDFTKITGTDRQAAQYLPVAFLLRSGYGCAGYYNSDLNQGVDEMCVLLNARVVCLRDRVTGGDQPAVKDFNDFLEEIVTQYNRPGGGDDPRLLDSFGKSIPLTAIPYGEVAVFYPVAQIGRMMQSVRKAPTMTEPAEADLKIEITPGVTPPLPAAKKPAATRPAVAATSSSVKPTSSRPAPAKPGTTTKTPPAAAKPAPTPEPAHEVPTFFDFNNKSVVLQALRTKLW